MNLVATIWDVWGNTKSQDTSGSIKYIVTIKPIPVVQSCRLVSALLRRATFSNKRPYTWGGTPMKELGVVLDPQPVLTNS